MTQLEAVQVQDLEFLLPWIDEFNRADGIKTSIEVIRPALKRLLEYASLGGAWFIVHDQVRVGYLTLTFGFDLEYGGRDGWIPDVYIRPDYQGRGIGQAAVKALESKARALGVRALHLMVNDHNQRASHVYAKQGFGWNPRRAMLKVLN